LRETLFKPILSGNLEYRTLAQQASMPP